MRITEASAKVPATYSRARFVEILQLVERFINYFIRTSYVIPISDETTAITTGAGKVTLRLGYAFSLTEVPRASLTTASSSGTPTFDINVNGSSILSTKITIEENERTSTTATVPAVYTTSEIPEDAEITLDIDVAGTGAKGAKIILIGRQS